MWLSTPLTTISIWGGGKGTKGLISEKATSASGAQEKKGFGKQHAFFRGLVLLPIFSDVPQERNWTNVELTIFCYCKEFVFQEPLKHLPHMHNTLLLNQLGNRRLSEEKIILQIIDRRLRESRGISMTLTAKIVEGQEQNTWPNSTIRLGLWTSYSFNKELELI